MRQYVYDYVRVVNGKPVVHRIAHVSLDLNLCEGGVPNLMSGVS
jgi:hypothetical protein